MKLGHWVALVVLVRAVSLAAMADPATNVMGADKVIRIVAERMDTPLPATPVASNTVQTVLQRDLDAFVRARDGLVPTEAAAQWLALFDRCVRVPATVTGRSGNRSWYTHSSGSITGSFIRKAIIALPPPAAWPALHNLIARRPPAEGARRTYELVLRMVSSFLVGDSAGLRQGMIELAKLGEESGGEQSEITRALPELAVAIQDFEDARLNRSVLELFQARLALLRQYPPRSVEEVRLPDLVALAGTNEAERLITEAFRIPKVRLSIRAGMATRELARAIALRQLDQLTLPPWELCVAMEPEAQALYEALEKKFAVPVPSSPVALISTLVSRGRISSIDEDYQSRGAHAQARCYFALASFLGGRTNEAGATLAAFTDSTASYEMKSGFERALRGVPVATRLEFLTFAIQAKPDAELWDYWMAAAMEAGETNRVIPLLKAAEAKLPTVPDRRQALLGALAAAWLAMDNVDEGGRLLRAQMAMPEETDEVARANWQQWRQVECGVKLARLGKLINRPEWVEEGIAYAVEQSQKQSAMSSYVISSILDLLVERHEFARAEKLVVDAIRAAKKTASGGEFFVDNGGELAQNLGQLVRIYSLAGRHADVITLIEQAPWWGVADLAEIGLRGNSVENLRAMVAAALHSVGRDEEAARLVRDYLIANPGDDAAYATLLAIGGDDLVAWLDALYVRDRFEERPLIWKAVILQKAGMLDEAEATVRQAMKVDPTDGETKAGDRVRSYSVLADILAAKGKAEEAAFFNNVVKSVRIAEQGDELTHAGLVLRSLPVYEQAQSLFADAYCIQWRLAERFSAKGNMVEAEKHYRIAFERMPEQFGKVASLCFGCEGVFKSRPSQTVAERVLRDLTSRSPVKPQVYYLLGQLREIQERLPEAYEAYTKAAELDPSYLDALEKRYRLGSSMTLQPAEQDRLALTIVAIDPLGRHASVDYTHIQDASGLWKVVQANQGLVYTPLKQVLALPASKRQLAAARSEQSGAGSVIHRSYMMMRSGQDANGVPSPGEALLKISFMTKLLSLVRASSGSDFESLFEF